MRYIQGTDRDQVTLLPEIMDDYVSDNNPVRFIEAFVDNLDMNELSFTYATTKHTGRKPYNPKALLKLYIYGYLNKTRSSRQLEKATHRNIELIWLMQKLHPDFKTIADFRKDNTKSLKKVCREFTLLCKKLDLFGGELIAIDGSKFSASNSNRRNYTRNKLEKLIKKIDEQVNEYLNQMDKSDQAEESVADISVDELNQKIEQLKERKEEYQELQAQIENSDSTQISLTDADSKMMHTHQGKDVSFNVQIVTDSKHKLIPAHDVTNDCNDQKQLHPMASEAKEILEVDEIDAVADTGYFDRENLKKCHDNGITTYVPHPEKSNYGLYTRNDFQYNTDEDTYLCPAGQALTFRGLKKIEKTGITEKKYTTHACYTCKQKQKCTKSKTTRYIYRWVHEEIIEQMTERLEENKEMIEKRKALVEHPFGTIKHWMNHGYFLTRGLENVRGEMSISVLVYNLKRVLNIVDFKELMAAVA
jgi:transposase